MKVASDDNPADLGTKSPPTATHQRHCSACNVGPLAKFIGTKADAVAAASAARAGQPFAASLLILALTVEADDSAPLV
eukprot:13672814-Alexandrium_andersonii.AAC.1